MPTIRNIEGLDKESQGIFDLFLICYEKGSGPTYKNAFKLIYENTGKSSLTDLTIEDYRSLIDHNIHRCVTQIFKFLYVNGYLKNSRDFELEFGNKKTIPGKFNAIKKNIFMPYSPAVPAKEFDKIITWVEKVENNKFEDIRLAFCFYMLFYNPLDVGQVGHLDAKNYALGKIRINEDIEIDIPDRFHSFLEDLKKKKTNTKFTIVNEYIDNLGNKVGINNLNPIDITEARKQRSITCPECGNKYLATFENWISVNNYLMCKDCGEKQRRSSDIKKNRIIKKTQNLYLDFDSDIKEQDEPYNSELDLTNQDVSDFDSMNLKNPESRMVTINRLVRDTKKSRELKEKYENKCQLCGCQLRSANGQFMSEAHHIQPYNKTHKGCDTKRNLIILCPNHHAQFDQLFYAIEPYTHKVHCLFNSDQYHLKIIVMAPGHSFGEDYLKYIWDKFCERKKQVGDFIWV